MMTEKASDLASSREKKKRSYSVEFKKQVVVYVEANSNRSAASHFVVEPKRVREWRKDFEKIKSTKPNRKRLDEGGRKCIDENLEEDLVHWIYEKQSKMLHVSRKMIIWKAKSIFNDKTTVLPSKIRLLLVVDGVKSLCEGMGSLLEEKLQLLIGIHRIWLIVAYVMHVQNSIFTMSTLLQWRKHMSGRIWSPIPLLRKQVQKNSPWNRLGMIKSMFLFV